MRLQPRAGDDSNRQFPMPTACKLKATAAAPEKHAAVALGGLLPTCCKSAALLLLPSGPEEWWNVASGRPNIQRHEGEEGQAREKKTRKPCMKSQTMERQGQRQEGLGQGQAVSNEELNQKGIVTVGERWYCWMTFGNEAETHCARIKSVENEYF